MTQAQFEHIKHIVSLIDNERDILLSRKAASGDGVDRGHNIVPFGVPSAQDSSLNFPSPQQNSIIGVPPVNATTSNSKS